MKKLINATELVNGYIGGTDWRVKENSNSPKSFGGLNKYIAGEVTKNYWLNEVYTEKIKDAYLNGDLHIHDLGALTLYCCGYSLENILLMGVQGIDNIPTSAPASHFDSALNQVANLLTVYQNEIAGAVALNSFDTLLAPFIANDNLTKKQVKQSLQNFIYSINSNSRGGAEPAFTNITLDITPTEEMLKKQVIIGGEYQESTYGDFQAEMDLFNEVFTELMLQGDSNGEPFAYPIITYNIGKRFDWDNPKTDAIFEMAGKFGYPYFANFVNSDMSETDARSMALLGTQNLIFKDSDGRVTTNEIRNMVAQWTKNDTKPNYKVLMNGEFVQIIDMFQVPYKDEDFITNVLLSNGYNQKFSMYHKCQTYSNGEFKIVESQDLKDSDNFVISAKPWNINNGIGTYRSGKILGYYIAEGWKESKSNSQITFAININSNSVVEDIKTYFQEIGCEVKIDTQYDVNIHRINVYGKQAVGFVDQYVIGTTAKTKRLNFKLWNTNDEFRKGVFDGYLDTDGCKSHNIFAHTTNKELCSDFMTLASSIGKILKFRENKNNTRYFKEDKSDKIKFTSYELKLYDPTVIDDFYIIPITGVKLIKSNRDVVYNFTVDTNEHLFELPNGIISHQCCRLRLDLTELRRRNGGLFGSGDNTGSIGVVTINMPRIGYNSTDKENFYKNLDKQLRLAKKSLELKRAYLNEHIVNKGFIPAFDRYVGTLDNHFSTIGVVGLNEMCQNFLGKGILSEDGKEFALEVGEHIRQKLQEFQLETGNLYNFEATPAESTAYRLAKKDLELYDCIYTQGTKDAPYYTNSCHIPVSKVENIKQVCDNQDELQRQFTGGVVCHHYMNGSISGKQAKHIIKTIVTDYGMPYTSLSPITRYCPNHGYVDAITDTCPKCGSELDMYQRITGYTRKVKNFNIGKAQEFKERTQMNGQQF